MKKKLVIPKGACDCHHHIFDPERFSYIPEDTRNQPPSTTEMYKEVKLKLKTTRSVIVNPSAYGLDNSCTLDALKELGEDARAVVTIDETISEEELKSMNELGVKGIRFNFVKSKSVDVEKIREIAERIAKYNWHICFWISPALIVELEEFFSSLPCEVVFDHRGHLSPELGTNDKAFEVICKLMKEKKAWVKISGIYHDTKIGFPTYDDTLEINKKYVNHDATRVLWGSDWPHPSLYSQGELIPETELFIELMKNNIGNQDQINQILVKNPKELYNF